MKELGQSLTPGASALCVLVRQVTVDKVLEELHGTGGKVLKTNLTKEEETKLQAALNEARKAAQASAPVGVKS
jgi:uncharacterized membrane protein